MSEKQSVLVVKDEFELAAEVERLVADGWNIKTEHRSLHYLNPVAADRASRRRVTLERNSEKKVVRTKYDFMDVLWEFNAFELRTWTLAWLVVIVVALIFILTSIKW